MNRLARHEAAQRASMAMWRRRGYTVVSCSTTEVMDYLVIGPTGITTAVEIKTGSSRLKPRQKAWCMYPPCVTYVEHWRVTGTAAPELIKDERYAPKTSV